MQLSQLHAGVSGRPLPIRARQCIASRRPALEITCAVQEKESRIGKIPIAVPSGVTLEVKGQLISVKVRLGMPCAAAAFAAGWSLVAAESVA